MRTARNTIEVTADALEPGDVILTPGYDANGAYTEWEFEVTQVRVFARKVQLRYDGDSRRKTLDRDQRLRVRRDR